MNDPQKSWPETLTVWGIFLLPSALLIATALAAWVTYIITEPSRAEEIRRTGAIKSASAAYEVAAETADLIRYTADRKARERLTDEVATYLEIGKELEQ